MGDEFVEILEHAVVARAQPIDRVVTGGHERAVDADRMRDIEIMQRVADHQHLGGRQTEFGEPGAAEFGFAVRVDVVEAGEPDEAGGEAEVRHDFLQRFLAIGRQDRLREARALDGIERGESRRMQPGRKPAGVVRRDKLRAELFERALGHIESDALVVGANRKIERRMVAGAVHLGKTATAQHGIHDPDGKIEIVEQSAIPVPNHMTIGREHGGRTNASAEGLASLRAAAKRVAERKNAGVALGIRFPCFRSREIPR